jgi:hypothetical protein
MIKDNTKNKEANDEMPTTFPKKWVKVLKEMSEFKEIADAASTEDLKKIIITSEGNISVIEKAKLENVKINAAKEIIRDESAPFKDALKAQTCKVKYSIFLLEGRGVEVGNGEGE